MHIKHSNQCLLILTSHYCCCYCHHYWDTRQRVLRVIAEVQSEGVQKSTIKYAGRDWKGTEKFWGRKRKLEGEMGIVGDQEQHEQRHRDLNVQEWQISEVAAFGHNQLNFRDSLDPKRGSLECQAQKPQMLQVVWKSSKSSKTLSRSISACQWKITQYRGWNGKGRPTERII